MAGNPPRDIRDTGKGAVWLAALRASGRIPHTRIEPNTW